MNLKCTKILLDKLKIKDIDIKKDGLVLNQDLNNWHCNLLKFGRINTVLLTNDKTLYSFFLTGYKANDFKNFKLVASEDMFKILYSLDFKQKYIEIILNSLENITYSKTSNKSVLATMTQIKRFVELGIYRDENIIDINKKINSIPHKIIEYKTSSELFNELLKDNINTK